MNKRESDLQWIVSSGASLTELCHDHTLSPSPGEAAHAKPSNEISRKMGSHTLGPSTRKTDPDTKPDVVLFYLETVFHDSK